MKKLFIALVALLAIAPSTLASDFDYGVSDQGCYFVNEAQTLVYSRDASLIGQANACKKVYKMSSLWYVKRVSSGVKMPQSYYNRIKAMKLLNVQ